MRTIILFMMLVALGACASPPASQSFVYQTTADTGREVTVSDTAAVQTAEALLKKVAWDKTVSVDKGRTEDFVFWFVDQKQAAGTKYRVWFNARGSADVQDEQGVWGTLGAGDGKKLAGLFKKGER